MLDPKRIIDAVVHDAYARAVAYLAVRSGDITGTEEVLAAAFASARSTWLATRIPTQPEAWLLAATREWLVDSSEAMQRVVNDAEQLAQKGELPDERLALLFACAHPAIEAALHAPLMLQVVLGLDSASIATAFAAPAAALDDHLARAKAKLRDTAAAFVVPSNEERPSRLALVLEAMHVAYASGVDDAERSAAAARGMSSEAMWLARVLLTCLPEEPEVRGLLAVMLYCEARRPAERDGAGAYVPIAEQDIALWSTPAIEEAEDLLEQAAAYKRIARFQLEAALQSAHMERARGGDIDAAEIAALQQLLLRVQKSMG